VTEETKLLLQLVLGPAIGTVLSVLAGASGLSGKAAQVEYQIKRVALIEKLLTITSEENSRL
jgi:hypothetical protein